MLLPFKNALGQSGLTSSCFTAKKNRILGARCHEAYLIDQLIKGLVFGLNAPPKKVVATCEVPIKEILDILITLQIWIDQKISAFGFSL